MSKGTNHQPSLNDKYHRKNGKGTDIVLFVRYNGKQTVVLKDGKGKEFTVSASTFASEFRYERK